MVNTNNANNNSDEAIQNQLYTEAGVKPSLHWIHSYRAAQQQQQQSDSADVMLQHLLYHDLRDVVREMDDRNYSGGNRSNTNSPPQQWRQAVQSQQRSNNNGNNGSNTEVQLKTTLPDSFRLMIQLEEVIDVARNAETRLGGVNTGGGHQHQNTNSQTQQRCLKLCISDGFYDQGTAFPGNNATTQQQIPLPPAMLAIEVSLIPNLTMASKAGLKLLLHGSIDVRVGGVLMLHEGNTLVLGGSVQALVDIQAKALEDAKREAGVGVDPTVRALIWNPDTGEDDEEDEREQGSSDVVVPPPVPRGPQAPSTAAIAPNQQQQQQQQRGQNANANTNANAHANGNQQYAQQRNNNNNNNNTNNMQQVQQNRITPGPPPAASRAFPPPSQFRPMQTAQAAAAASLLSLRTPPLQGNNPYARNSNKRNNTITATASASASQRNSTAPSQSSSASTSTPSAASAATAMGPPTNRNTSTGNNQMNTPTTTAGNTASAAVVTAPRSQASTDVVMVDVTNPVPAGSQGSITTSMSFDELKELLTRVRQDENLYLQQFGKTFAVNMRQCASHHYFNIDKVKKREGKKKDKKKGDKKGEKKYGYAMHAKFSGPANSDDDCISCAISSDILEPYFVYSPAEMRTRNKANREASATHIRVSGRKANDAFLQLGVWEVTLVHSSGDFFRSPDEPSPPSLDGKRPILLLLSRCDS